ncbi:MAG: hypothetical protein AB1567_09620 [bacterium]
MQYRIVEARKYFRTQAKSGWPAYLEGKDKFIYRLQAKNGTFFWIEDNKEGTVFRKHFNKDYDLGDIIEISDAKAIEFMQENLKKMEDFMELCFNCEKNKLEQIISLLTNIVEMQMDVNCKFFGRVKKFLDK